MENKKDEIVDVRSVVEAIAASEDSNSDAPLYQVESLCMRCGENVWSLSSRISILFLFYRLAY